VQLVDEAVDQQIVPERAAAEDQDVLTGLSLEPGDPLVGVRAADDAGVAPRFRLFWGQTVRYDHLVYGVVEPRYLPLEWPGFGIIRHRRPESLEPVVRGTSEEQCVGRAQPLGVVGVEALVRRVSPTIVEQGHDVLARPLVETIQGHGVAHDQFARSLHQESLSPDGR
jgi:hypothetical protein